MPHVHMHALTQCCFHSLVSSQTFRRVLTALMDGCTEVKSLPSVALLILATFGGRVLEIKAWSGSVDIIGLAETQCTVGYVRMFILLLDLEQVLVQEWQNIPQAFLTCRELKVPGLC